MPLFDCVTDLTDPLRAEVVRRRHYGYVETVDGRLRRIVLRPWPKITTAIGGRTLGRLRRRFRSGKRCRLYFNQPRSCPNFLALRYVESTGDADYATFRRALAVLDEIARLKGIDALLCDAANPKLSDRFLARLGWEPHAPMLGHRNFIKRLR
jgi:hypothetical protein